MNGNKGLFRPTPWEGVSEKDWQDWRWQLRNRVTTLTQLQECINLHPDELAGVKVSQGRFVMSITPYWIALMDKEDPRCPIRRQMIPHIKETHTSKYDYVDPCSEEKDSPVPGVVHRYPDRILFICTDKCAAYCRFCTRKRIVSEEEDILIEKRLEQAVAYIKKNKQIRDVLISGGDPLTYSDAKLDYILKTLRAIPQIEIIRIGTRIPVTMPQRITDGLLSVLSRNHPLYISLHINHPLELTVETRQACNCLANKGVPLGSQTVLLRGINDSVEVMKRLMQQLLTIRVRPYYIYQCDPIIGTEHFRTTVAKGIEIIKGLRGFTSGYAVPTYVIDAPGGGGKVPIAPDYVVRYEKASSDCQGKIVIRNFSGKSFTYVEPPVSAPRKRIKVKQKEEAVV